VRSDDEWSRLALLIGGDDLAADARFATAVRRQEAADVVDEVLAAWTAQRGAAEVEAELQQLGIPVHVAQTSADAVADPQLQHRGHFVELDHPLHGKTVVEAPRYKLSRTPAAIARAAPGYGQDNHHVLHEILGYDEQRIAALSASGALA
jgi:crotonobetainyl-CoA:carnitine CoA-transferase CaiB-like acyl-CoA transferase